MSPKLFPQIPPTLSACRVESRRMPRTLARPPPAQARRGAGKRAQTPRQNAQFPPFRTRLQFVNCAPSTNGMVRCHMCVPSHGHGLLRSESLFAHTPPELRCVKVIRRTGQRCKNIRRPFGSIRAPSSSAAISICGPMPRASRSTSRGQASPRTTPSSRRSTAASAVSA